MSLYPDSNFIYVSYSHSLAKKQTQTIRDIMNMPHYKKIFGVELKEDSQAKDNFETTQGGSVYAVGSGGTITGRGAGIKGIDRFGGIIVCFPHDQKIQTELGALSIGEIVNKKLSILVPSVNLKTKQVEYKKIVNWFKNPGKEIIEIKFNNSESIRCTPDHKIWTDNRGWIEAQNLCFYDKLISPSPNSPLRKSENFPCFSLWNRKISQNIQLIFIQSIKFIFFQSWRSIFPSFFCYITPFIATSNSINGASMNTKSHSNIFGRFIAKNNINNFLVCMNRVSASFSQKKSAMFFRINNVLRSATICKIINVIIKPISIKMSCIKFIRFFSNKSKSNKDMNKKFFCNFIFSKASNKIFSRFSKIFYSCLFYSERAMIVIKNFSFFRSNSSKSGSTITSIISGNSTPFFIRKIGHIENTYCINVEDNHNFFCGESEDNSVLVANCDDLLKPDESSSSLIREGVNEWYYNTLQSRTNSPNTPIVLIGQRLHEDDISAHLMKTGEWDTVIIKAIDDAGNPLHPEMHSKHTLLKMQETSPYEFAAQYQQDPQPSGGGIFKPDWFVLLDEEPKIIKTFITVDSAERAASYNDATVFSFWGLYKIKHGEEETDLWGLHWLDCIELRVEPKDLYPELMQFYAECMRHPVKPKEIAIEKKSTGSTLESSISQLQGLRSIDITTSINRSNKTDRFLSMQSWIAQKHISFTRYAKHVHMCIEHMRKISANESHRWDDICDTAYSAIKLALIDKIFTMGIEQNSVSTAIVRDMAASFNRISKLRNNANGRSSY